MLFIVGRNVMGDPRLTLRIPWRGDHRLGANPEISPRFFADTLSEISALATSRLTVHIASSSFRRRPKRFTTAKLVNPCFVLAMDSGLRRNDDSVQFSDLSAGNLLFFCKPQPAQHTQCAHCVAPAALYRSPPDAALRRTQKTLAKIEAAQQQFHGQT